MARTVGQESSDDVERGATASSEEPITMHSTRSRSYQFSNRARHTGAELN